MGERGYYVVGTWTAWERSALMVEEAEGVYRYTIEMGENNWECFQIRYDDDEERVLHPSMPRESQDSPAWGPDSEIGQDLCWYISGIPEEETEGDKEARQSNGKVRSGPGDKYCIRLHIRKYKRVEWSRQDPSDLVLYQEPEPKYVHRYCL